MQEGGITLKPYSLVSLNWPLISTFVIGMLTGFVLLSLFIAFLLIRSRKSKEKLILSHSQPLESEVITKMIQSKQQELMDTIKVSDNAYFRVAMDLSMDLVFDIAKHYFPNSTYPIYELSIQEIMDLVAYIHKRAQAIVNHKFIRLFKNSRISTIVDILNKKKAIDNSKIMKWNRQYKISKVLSYAGMVLNYANPIYWFRKLALKPSTTLVIKEACKKIIEIAGEETNKIYSKKLFMSPDDPLLLEQTFDQITEEAYKTKE
jgi:hypothetical protein